MVKQHLSNPIQQSTWEPRLSHNSSVPHASVIWETMYTTWIFHSHSIMKGTRPNNRILYLGTLSDISDVSHIIRLQMPHAICLHVLVQGLPMTTMRLEDFAVAVLMNHVRTWDQDQMYKQHIWWMELTFKQTCSPQGWQQSLTTTDLRNEGSYIYIYIYVGKKWSIMTADPWD